MTGIIGRGGRTARALVAAATAAALTGCGKQGPLEQPAPLFGARAKAEYREQQAVRSQQAQDRAAARNAAAQGNRTPAADVPDDAPRTARDLRDPNEQLTSIRQAPIPGSNNDKVGSPPTLTPPN